MVNYEIISEKAVSTSEVIEVIKKQDPENLTYREEKILEFLKKRNSISIKDFKAAFKEISALEIPRLEDFHIIKLIELNPKDGTTLRAIISNSGTVIVDENVTKILDVLKKYN